MKNRKKLSCEGWTKCASHARDVTRRASACVRGGAAGVCTSHMRNAVVVNVLRCGSGLGDGAGSGRPTAPGRARVKRARSSEILLSRRTHRTVEQRFNPCGRSHMGPVRQCLFHSRGFTIASLASEASRRLNLLRVVYGQTIGPAHNQRTTCRTGHGD